jgi:gliding motility-associated-like protein
MMLFHCINVSAQALGSPCDIAESISGKEYCSLPNTITFSADTNFANPNSTCNSPLESKWFQFTASNTFSSLYIANSDPTNTSILTLGVFKVNVCDSDLEEIFCDDSGTLNWMHIELPNLQIGQQYLITIGSLSQNHGEIDFCLNSYFPFGNPGNNCEEAIILCDSSPKVYVPSKPDASDLPFSINSCNSQREMYSETWYKWRADKDGPISFTISPLFTENNIDFEIYKVNDGIEDCELELLRCESVLNGLGSSCGLQTGLKEGSTELLLSTTCDNITGSFLSPLNALKGDVYALRILSQSQNAGYQLTFDHQPEFFNTIGVGFGSVLSQVGPCTYQLKYSANGFSIPPQSYQWDIGSATSSENELTDREVTIITSDLGSNIVQVSFPISYGCIVTEVDSNCILERLSGGFFGIQIDSIKGIQCGEVDGSYLAISMDVKCPDYEGFTYSIDGSPFSSQQVFTDLSLGSHVVSVRLDEGCEVSRTIAIEEEVDFDGEISSSESDPTDCFYSYDFSIQLSGELLGSETVIWDFGPNAIPATAIGIGPHSVEFEEIGLKEIRANITASTACSREVNFSLNIQPCMKVTTPEIFVVEILEADCNDENGGLIFDILNACEPLQYFLNEIPIEPSSLENLASGKYNFKIVDKDFCTAEQEIQIGKEEDLILNAGPDLTVNLVGSIVTFELDYNYADVSISTNSNNILCQDSVSCTSPSLEVNSSESIIFTASNSIGCAAEDTVNINLEFDPAEILYVPNVFSPNEDGINDVFEIFVPESYSIEVKQFRIFDRWGNLIFQKDKSQASGGRIELWNGSSGLSTTVKSGVFAFIGTFIVSEGGIQKEITISQTISAIQ